MKSIRLIVILPLIAWLLATAQAQARSLPTTGRVYHRLPAPPAPHTSSVQREPGTSVGAPHLLTAPAAPAVPAVPHKLARPASTSSPLVGTNTFVVTTTSDSTGCPDPSGAVSLRCAIFGANHSPANVGKVIDFAIPGCGPVPCVIELGSDLPPFTADNITVDGYSQPGASPNTLAVGDNAHLAIQIDGKGVKNPNQAFLLLSNHDTIEGLSITNYGYNGAINSQGVGNHIAGNFLGLTPNGAAGANANGVGVFNVGGQIIGGTTPADRNVISGNSQFGVWLAIDGNTVEGNYIGTNPAGTAPRPNAAPGVGVTAGTKNTIGGRSEAAGNLISGNASNGVSIWSNGNTVQGNYIGTDATGSAVLPNAEAGISVSGSGNTFGGTTPGARNVISGNLLLGIAIFQSGNTIEGNYIGTDASGTVALANAQHGVYTQADNTTIGGAVAGAGNVISGNRLDGIYLVSGKNTIAGNYFGTNAAGTDALPNGGAGIEVYGSGNGNVIGGSVPAARNVVSGNGSAGIILWAGGNTMQGNEVGTNAAGTGAVPNGADGIALLSSGNTVGGASPSARNVIGSNAWNGINVFNSGNTVQENYIGTNATGTAPLGNVLFGVAINSGASATITGNLVSGNGESGIDLSSGGNTVAGNIVGTNAPGTAALGNGWSGIAVESTGNTIGGTTAAARNLISGNGLDGITVTADKNTIKGNYLGTNASGTASLGNGEAGIYLYGAGSNVIGGNLISGNRQAGIAAEPNGSAAAGFNTITGNSIGTTAAGTAAIANYAGVILFAGGNLVGSAAPGARNVISGNTWEGVVIASGTSNIVQGNSIGTNAAGTRSLPNGGNGVWVISSATNSIGGTSSGAGNIIADNGASGVLIGDDASDGSADGNQILHNSIFTNRDLGITLAGQSTASCTTAIPKAEAAPNDNIACPLIASASPSLVKGTGLSGATVEVFLAQTGKSDVGHGEGVTYLGTATVGQNGTWQLGLQKGQVKVGQQVTATQTHSFSLAGLDTSEFAANVTVH